MKRRRNKKPRLLAPLAAIFAGIAQIESKSLQDFSGKFLEMQDDIHSSCRLAAALIAGLIAIVVNTAMLEASRCRRFQDGFHILVGLLMAVFYAFVLEPVLAGSALVKGLVYALLVWLANAFTSSCSPGSAKAHSLSMWQNPRFVDF